MTRALVVASLLGVLGTARADDTTLARAHVRHATTAYLSTSWSPGPTVPIRIGVEGALRLHRGSVAIEGRVGLGGAGSVTALGTLLAGHVGVSVGGAIALSGRIVLAPMVSYDVFGEWERDGASFAVHYVTLLVPLSIVLERGVVIEPFVQVGAARYQGATDPAVVIGPRLGIVF